MGIFFRHSVLPIQISQFTKFPTSTLKGPIINGGRLWCIAAKRKRPAAAAVHQAGLKSWEDAVLGLIYCPNSNSKVKGTKNLLYTTAAV
jgi:hypothetical protein